MNNLDKLVETIYKRMIINSAVGVVVNDSGKGILQDKLGTFPDVYVQCEKGSAHIVVVVDGMPKISHSYIKPLDRELKIKFKIEIKNMIVSRLNTDKILRQAVETEIRLDPTLIKGE